MIAVGAGQHGCRPGSSGVFFVSLTGNQQKSFDVIDCVIITCSKSKMWVVNFVPVSKFYTCADLFVCIADLLPFDLFSYVVLLQDHTYVYDY